MRAKVDFDPIQPDELQNLPFDFSEYLATGDTINTIQAWNCTVWSGSPVPDSSASTRPTGGPATDPTKTKVIQAVTGCVDGVIYVMEALVSTTNGEKLGLWAFIECKAAGKV